MCLSDFGTQYRIADVHDWGTHPYATAEEEGSTLMLYIYSAQEKKTFLRNGKTCTSTELRNRGRPAWEPSGIGTVQLMGPSNM